MDYQLVRCLGRMLRLWLQAVVFQSLVPSKFLITAYATRSSSYFSTESTSFSLGKVITVCVPSVRFDKVARKGLNMTQFDFEKAFYNQKFRLNKEKLLKKSRKLDEGDILDLVTREECGKIYGKRVILINVAEKGCGFSVTLNCVRQIHQLYANCSQS
ncbi:hypothetical protein ECG_01546 [Echinococcus granulosus]|uniref:Expressed conserved protein n=1 Tax=Echinococcus granulosus TaxID=6210 RepID=A0A068WAS7_ECHGR|nr:hypothetical protein ECG_01546 [Echinococcus granulosus]CDS15525.1 expressed conserved protein [Echinococcus granulosus]